MSLLAEFVRVSPQLPCPICLKPDWCLVSRDGKSAICQRVESDVAWEGKRGSRVGYLHELSETIDVPQTATQQSAKLASESVAELVDYWCHTTDRNARVCSLAQSLGVECWTLKELSVGWRGDCYSFPMRDGDGKFCGVRFRGIPGVFGGDRKWSLKGGREGVFAPRSLRIQSRMFVTEGASDCAAMLSLGLPTIGRPNRCASWDHVEATLTRCEATDIVLVSDSDPDGRRDTQQLEKILAAKFARVRSIVPTAHKDAREVFRAGGRDREILHCVSEGDNEFWKRL